MNAQVFQGDALHLAGSLASDSIDAVITDPPYGLKFMGKGWDHGVPGVEFWLEALRVLKPGGHLLAFGGTRTHHRLMVAIEDAGFEIRDCLMWLYGQGFPKSLDVSKAIDKAAGAERERIPASGGLHNNRNLNDDGWKNIGDAGAMMDSSTPATEAAQQWDGWGTALKPAWEPIILARKPLIGTVAANVTAHGTGALNIDGCRIEGSERPRIESDRRLAHNTYGPGLGGSQSTGTTTLGRWPANVVLDEDAAAMLDEMSGVSTSKQAKRKSAGQSVGNGETLNKYQMNVDNYGGHNDTGGASRFFYCAKASRSERNKGLEGMPERGGGCLEGNADTDNARKIGANPDRPVATTQNHHPTVKPIALMRWLCRLVTPPGGTILDPFNGSGSTGCAAVLEGFRYLGFELDQDFVDISIRRIDHWTPAS